MNDSAEWQTCEGCGWLYVPSPNDDRGYCGPCARERGLAPRTPATDWIDNRFRIARELNEQRRREEPKL